MHRQKIPRLFRTQTRICSIPKHFQNWKLYFLISKLFKKFHDRGNPVHYMELTLVMADQVLQGGEGDARGDVEASVVQRADLIMLDGFPALGVRVLDGQGVAACGRKQRIVTTG